jgi:hypothetical protein
MGETAEQIRDEIDTQRQVLGDNLHQLEAKVKDTMDWRARFEQHPMMGVGAAFASGFLLSVLMPGGGSDSKSKSYAYDQSNYRVRDESTTWQGSGGYSESTDFTQKQRSPEMNEISETVENIRGAVMGLAATRLRSFLAEAVPGFEQEYEEARRKRGSSEASKINTSTGTATQTSNDRSSWQSQGTGSSDSALRGSGGSEGAQPGRMPAEPRSDGEQDYRP